MKAGDELRPTLFKVTRTWYVEAFNPQEAVQLARMGDHVAVSAESTNTNPFLRNRERDAEEEANGGGS